jgi:uncharacterized protein (TIGR00251 family)
VIEPTASGVRIRLRVQPRASRNEVAGEHGDALRVRLTAPPVDGAANEALVRFLAERLGVTRSAVRLVAGASGRSKVVEIDGVGEVQARARLVAR